MFRYLFSFKGRINRAKMWLFLAVAFVWLLSFHFGMLRLTPLVEAYGDTARGFLATLWILPIFYIYVAVFVKRLHDRDRSGWWFVVFWVAPTAVSAVQGLYMGYGILPENFPAWVNYCDWIAVILAVWAIVELFLLRGTRGENRFGPDPLQYV